MSLWNALQLTYGKLLNKKEIIIMLKQDFFKDLLIDLKYQGKNIKGLSISTAKDIHGKTVGLVVTKNLKSLLVNINDLHPVNRQVCFNLAI
jgi:ABC-type microcin C transport system duplicated ATPase subunit YejF